MGGCSTRPVPTPARSCRADTLSSPPSLLTVRQQSSTQQRRRGGASTPPHSSSTAVEAAQGGNTHPPCTAMSCEGMPKLSLCLLFVPGPQPRSAPPWPRCLSGSQWRLRPNTPRSSRLGSAPGWPACSTGSSRWPRCTPMVWPRPFRRRQLPSSNGAGGRDSDRRRHDAVFAQASLLAPSLPQQNRGAHTAGESRCTRAHARGRSVCC